MENSEELYSEWNMAKATLRRMDLLLRESSELQKTLQGEPAYRALRALYREVYPQMHDDERQEVIVLLNECVKEVANLDRGKKAIKITPELSMALEYLDLFLKDCMRKHNLYLPNRSDPGMAMMDDDD